MLPNLATTTTTTATTNNMLSDQNQRYLKQIQSKTLELERERKG
jgi:poly-D-alanine transfer protein DltD